MDNKSLGLKVSLKKAQEKTNTKLEFTETSSNEIGIIGMAGMIGDADDLDTFWEGIKNGSDLIGKFPLSRRKDTDNFLSSMGYDISGVKYAEGAYLKRIDFFDPLFFKISPKEAALIDPQQRLFLEVAYQALEDAGYGGDAITGSRTGVFLGYSSDSNLEYRRLLQETDLASQGLGVPGNIKSIMASRIAYILDLHGPSMVIDTACSSTMTAIHQACMSLRKGECEMAIVGGVSVNLLPMMNNRADIGIQSTTQRAHTFDDSADGTGFGEGVVALLLKPLLQAKKDQDHIYAVIKGSGINQDGKSIGITAPNGLAQAEVIETSWKDARINPLTVSYIEAHGTGTELGDPIEIDAINRAYKKYTDRKQFCAVSSVKTNIGHLDSAAGIAGIVKAVLALKHKKIPPLVHFQRPNRVISFPESAVFPVDRLISWKSKGSPLRCGVSSFGLSGTNCHLILEEPPIPGDREEILDEESYFILPLSAKNETVLRKLVHLYDLFITRELINSPDGVSLSKIANICYTAAVGRGHYDHRLAIIFKNISDLQTKLAVILAGGDDRFVNEDILELTPDVYYGQYKLINHTSNRNVNAGERENTELEKLELDQTAAKCMSQLLEDNRMEINIYRELARLYTRGANINWKGFYKSEKQGQIRRRISIPVYPFDRKRCWLELREQHKNKREKLIKHPLLDKLIADSIYKIYQTQFSVNAHWELAEHQIMGQHTIPDTAYIEMAYQVGREFNQQDLICIEDVTFATPFVIAPDEVKEVHLVINKHGKSYDFAVVSGKDKDSGNYLTHAGGKISFKPVERQSISRDLQAIIGRCSLVVDKKPDERTPPISALGPHWDSLQNFYLGDGEFLVELQLKEKYTGELLTEYSLHPALLDNAVNLVIRRIKADLYRPVSFKKIQIYNSLTSRLYCYLKNRSPVKENSDTIVFDVTIMTEDGDILVAIEEYIIRHVPMSIAGSQTLDCYQLNWVNTPILSLEKGNIQTKQTTLIIMDEVGLGDKLSQRLGDNGSEVVKVHLAQTYSKLHSNEYVIPVNEAGFVQLFTELQNKSVKRIIHLATFGRYLQINHVRDLEDALHKGVYGLFYLIKALYKTKKISTMEMILISENAYRLNDSTNQLNFEQTKPHNASFLALGKVISQENPQLRCRGIDIDRQISVERIQEEILHDCRDYLVMYRRGRRYVEELQELETTREDFTESVQITPRGVYLITGGTGGIGLEIARYLSQKSQITLVLLSRSGFPERGQWSAIGRSNQTRLAQKLRIIREIEDNGSTIMIYSCDVSRETRLCEVLTDLQKRFGRLDGIIHAAGIAGKGFMITQDESQFKEVLAPKIIGTWLLDQLTCDMKLDFFLLFSSVTSIVGSPGQGDYTAANAYLDSYAENVNCQGRKFLAINWPAWKDTGMAVEHKVNFDKGLFKPVSTGDGLAVIDKLLNSVQKRVIPGNLNLELLVGRQGELPLQLGTEIYMKLQNLKQKIDKVEAKKVDYRGLASKGSELEEKIGQIWAEVLELEQVALDDDFFELGGHSLNATMLAAEINRVLSVEISIADIFNQPTVAKLAKLLSGAKQEKFAPIEVLPFREMYPMSSAQKRMYVLHQWGGISYNLPGAMLVEGPLDKRRFEKAFRQLILRHESLRTSFEMKAGELYQRVHEDVEFRITYTEVNTEAEIKEIAKKFYRRFDLQTPPLFRVALIKVDAKHVFLYDLHHIISDGFSLALLIQDFIWLYQGEELPGLRIQYKDFAVWQNNLFTSGKLKKLEDYWLEVFTGEIPVLNLPTDYPRPAVMKNNGAEYTFELTGELRAKISKYISGNGLTLYVFFLTVYNILLYKYTGQEDIVIGSPVAGRIYAELEKIIGLFVNTLAMRNYPIGEKSFADFIQEVKDRSFAAYDHQEYQFETLIDRLGLKRNLNRNPLFDTMLNVQNTPSAKAIVKDLKFLPYEIPSQVSKFDLSLEVFESERSIQCTIEYSRELFKRERIERMAGHFVQIIDSIIRDSDIQVGRINLLTDSECRIILEEFNSIKVEFPKDVTVHQYIERYALNSPNKIALECGEISLTYSQLHNRVTQLALLLRTAGLKTEDTVAVLMERSPVMCETILSIWKAGGAYIPIDLEYPNQRIQEILLQAGTKLLIVNSDDQGYSAEQCERWSSQDRSLEILDFSETKRLKISTQDEQTWEIEMGRLAYIIFTSGSTGKPKGAMVEHIGMMNHLYAKINDLQLSEKSIIVQNASHCFDISIWQFFAAHIVGGKTVIYPNEVVYDVDRFLSQVKEDQVTILEVVPSYLSAMLTNIEYKQYKMQSLTYLLVTGETVQPVLVRNWFKHFPKIKLVNAYGPTEASDDITHYIMNNCVDLPQIPIGRPIQNMQIYIVDKDQNLVPIGVKGEIMVSGIGVGRGYVNEPEKTDQAFSKDFWNDSEDFRMYRTGDIGAWLEDGNIQFYGRKDYQIKIHGFRIELGEIETVLTDCPMVKNAVVKTVGDPGEDQYLCAYLVKQLDENNQEAGLYDQIDEEFISQIKSYLRERLPEYMIPTYFLRLETLPLTSNGKIDRNKLPDINQEAQRYEFLPPVTELEKELAEIWSNILAVERIGIQDNFFDLGGNSVKLLSMISIINNKFSVQLKFLDVFQNTTIVELVKHLQTDGFSMLGDSLIKLRSGTGSKNIFFVHPLDGGVHWFLELSKYIDREYTVYALQAKGLLEKTELPQSVAEVASSYLREIKTVQESGPYILSAFCLGGMLGYEMLKQLEDSSTEVGSYIMLDSPSFKMGNKLGGQVYQLRTYLQKPKIGILTRFKGAALKLQNGLNLNLMKTKDPSEKDSLGLQIEVEKNMYYLLSTYKPDRLVNTDFIQIKAVENADKQVDSAAWSSLTSGEVVMYETAGDHYSMLEEPLVKETGILINRILLQHNNLEGTE